MPAPEDKVQGKRETDASERNGNTHRMSWKTAAYGKLSGTGRGVRIDLPKGRRQVVRGFIIAGALLLLLAAASGWLAYKTEEIAGELRAAEALVPQLEADVASQKTGDANLTIDEISHHTASARKASEDPAWKLAGAIPVLGANFTAVSELALAADDVVQGSARPLLQVATSLNWERLAPVDGKLDVGALEDSAPAMKSATNTLDLTHARLQAINKSQLLPQVADPLDRVTLKLQGFRDTMSTAANVATALPPMMGSNEPRNYLFLVQNNAELRALGGLPGALALVRVDDGSIELVKQSSGSSIGKFSPSIEVDDAQVDIYSSRLGTYISDVNLTPDFPTAARTAAAMWEARHGDSIDGVVAIDPVVLGHILEASGPVALTEGLGSSATNLPSELNSENVVPTLLSDVYKALDTNASQDEFFAAASEQVFQALVSGKATGPALLRALSRSLEENRVHLWSDHVDDQEILKATKIGGAISGVSVGSASFGVYFNDGTGAKMDYYMKRSVQLVQVCTGNEYMTYRVRVRTINTAPLDADQSLPASITGDGRYGTPPGTVQTNVVVYGPAWSHVDTAVQNGAKVSFGSHLHDNRPVGVVSTRLSPGESSELEMTFVQVVQDAEPTLSVTPTVQDVKDVTLGMEIAECQ
jgi:hypothetical protein